MGWRTACAEPAGAAIPTWSGCVRGVSSMHPMRSCGPPTQTGVEAVLTAVRGKWHRRRSVWRRGRASSGESTPWAGAHEAVVSLDLAHLRSIELDPTSLTATLGPGLSGPDAEAALAGARG